VRRRRNRLRAFAKQIVLHDAHPALTCFLWLTGSADQLYYPESLHKLFVVNTPAIISVAWRLIAPWVDARTKSKIVFLKPHETAEELLKHIREEDLPVHLGGKCACPGGCLLDEASGEEDGCSSVAIKIKKGAQYVLPVAVPARHTICWDFVVDEHDVVFSAVADGANIALGEFVCKNIVTYLWPLLQAPHLSTSVLSVVVADVAGARVTRHDGFFASDCGTEVPCSKHRARKRNNATQQHKHVGNIKELRTSAHCHAPQVTFAWDNSFAWLHSKSLLFRSHLFRRPLEICALWQRACSGYSTAVLILWQVQRCRKQRNRRVVSGSGTLAAARHTESRDITERSFVRQHK
jgi:hypothetical protein